MYLRQIVARRWRLTAAALAVAAILFGCGDDDGGGDGTIEYFPPGGVSEQMRSERGNAKLNLEHTAVSLLEAAGDYPGDTGHMPGVDEFNYHFEVPTDITLSVGSFDGEAPILIALDDSRNELGSVDKDSGDLALTVQGDYTIRLQHPRAGDETAEPILVFFQPIRPETAESGAVLAGANSNDVATLKAGKDCFRCDLKNLGWNTCPQGVTLAGINLSHADFTSAVLACQTFESKGSTPLLMTGANFTNVSLTEVILKGVDLTDADFTGGFFDDTTFDDVNATAAIFSSSMFMNSTFGAPQSNGSSAQGAYFVGTQIVKNSCFSAQDLRGADFTDAVFDDTSSVHSTWFAGANLYNVTFDGAKFQYDSTLPNCGRPTSCSGTVTVSGVCENCPCTADLGCLTISGDMACVENLGPFTVPDSTECERPVERAAEKGVVIEDTNLTGISFAGADLSNSTFATNTMDSTSDFAGANLSGVDFTMQDLGKSVDLSGAYLSETTDFTGATLTDAPATQRGVILSCDPTAMTGGCSFAAESTQFMGADMQYAELENAGLSEVNLEGANLSNTTLVGADLSYASLKGVNLTGAILGVAQGDGTAATMRNVYMINANLTDADMRTVDLTDAHIYGADTDALFVRTKLDSADLSGAILTAAVFTQASLTGTNFNGAQLVNASFGGANLSNAKFDDSYLQGADFSTAAAITGMSLSNAAVSTTLMSTMCKLIAPGTWSYMDQNDVPYTYQFGATMLLTDTTVICPDNLRGPCNTADSLCPIMSGPFPPMPTCVPVKQYCWENCEDPPCFKDMPDPTTGECPLVSNCS